MVEAATYSSINSWTTSLELSSSSKLSWNIASFLNCSKKASLFRSLSYCSKARWNNCKKKKNNGNIFGFLHFLTKCGDFRKGTPSWQNKFLANNQKTTLFPKKNWFSQFQCTIGHHPAKYQTSWTRISPNAAVCIKNTIFSKLYIFHIQL